MASLLVSLFATYKLGTVVVDIATTPEGRRMLDLRIYYACARKMLETGSPYGLVFEGSLGFTYPPFAALVFAPLSGLPLWAVQLIVLLLLIAVLVWFGVRLARLAGLGPWLGAGIVLLTEVAEDSLRLGQVSMLLVAVAVWDLGRPADGRWRGVALGVVGAIKLTPLVIVPLLWLTGHRRDARNALAGFLVATTLVWLLLPSASKEYWLALASLPERVGRVRSWGNFSLRGVLARTVGEGATVWLVLVVIICLVVAVLLIRSAPVDPVHVVAIGGVLGLIITPITWTHHMGWLLVAAAVLCRPGAGGPQRHWWASACVAVACLPMFFFGRELGRMGHPFLGGLVSGLRVAVCLGALAVLISIATRWRTPQVSPTASREYATING